MRIALVQCPPWGSLPPLGSASLKAYVELHGHRARCFDLNIAYCRERTQELLDDVGGSVYARPDPWSSGSYAEWDFEFDGEVRFTSALSERPLPVQRWVDEILAFEPDVAGFTVQSTNLGVTLQVAQALSRSAPTVRIVFGGPNVAEAQQGAMALSTGVPEVVVEGEGEETLVELLATFASGGALEDVAGIGLLVDGRPTWTPRRPLIRDVDALPFPDFSDFDWTMYPNPYEIPIMTSRGCVLNCAFCYETVYWKRFRTQSAVRIVAEIEHQIAHHPLRQDVDEGRARMGMAFADSLVNGHLGGLKRMAELLVERKVDIYWNGQATINTKMDDDFFRVLGESGCTGLSFGLESGSTHVLESMGKRFEIDQAVAFFERVQRAGIELVVNIMVGFPTETRADFVETLRFLRRIRRMIHMVNNVGATAVVGGSKIHSSPAEFGISPADPEAWRTASDLRWETAEAGTERNRERRVKLLHLWMTVMRIPHQRIGPTAERRFGLRRRELPDAPASAVPTAPAPASAVPTAPAPASAARPAPGPTAAAPTPPGPESSAVVTSTPVTMPRGRAHARLRRLTRATGEEPLVLEVRLGDVAAVLASPGWAERLDADRWVGLPMAGIRELASAHVSPAVELTEVRGADGVVEARLEATGRPVGELRGYDVRLYPPTRDEGVQLLALFPLWATNAEGSQISAGW